MESASLESDLRRYRLMAWIVGTLLVILFVGVFMKLLSTHGSATWVRGDHITSIVGTAHGFLYMVYLVTAAILARKARWGALFTVTTMLAGLIPLFTFVAERRATAVVRAANG